MPPTRILLAVSGGIDSMYMANTAPVLWPGAEFAVAHCNFGLRGEESDGDEAFVREWCRQHDTRLFVRNFDTKGYASSKGISLEMAARELRYAWFGELLDSEGFDAIAVAHNERDNAETLILNLLRGTGTKGLRGMGESDRLLRPLLGISREEISDRMKSNGWQWREDSSNAGNDFKRNKIRNRVFPVFEEINPSFLHTLSKDMEHFRQVDDIAEDYFQEARKAISLNGGNSPDEFRADALLGYRHWKYVLFRMLEKYEFSEQTLGKLISLLEKYKTEPRGKVTLGGKNFEAQRYVLKARKGGILSVYRKEDTCS